MCQGPLGVRGKNCQRDRTQGGLQGAGQKYGTAFYSITPPVRSTLSEFGTPRRRLSLHLSLPGVCVPKP